ncbi:hypothetical protein LC653_29115 [Nostoc sp. CHAB 5784]|nr:hypothetical protein [Nostoc mirabile]MCC5667830.1 hypothetical protein [Nostoc mirabile CHAB5784]
MQCHGSDRHKRHAQESDRLRRAGTPSHELSGNKHTSVDNPQLGLFR